MKQSLSAKELLFCTYYQLRRNGREAAAKSGYRLPERAAHRLLSRSAVQEQIARMDEQKRNKRDDVIAGYTRLAFGCPADAIRLLRAPDDEPLDPEALDLFLVSEIKKPKGGGLEIKFFDRLKALEHLETLAFREKDAAASGLYSAIEAGAAAWREDLGDG